MPFDPAGVNLKLDRATHHLDIFETALNEFVHSNPDADGGPGLEVKGDRERGAWSVVAHAPDTVPGEWSVWIGEVLYQLRSCLDHIVNGLVIEPTRSNAFPIYTRPNDYRSNCERLLEGVETRYRTIIYDLQPFRQKPDDPELTTLWTINELARLDRHRFLHPTDLWLLRCKIILDPFEAGVMDYCVELPWSVKDQTVVASGRILSSITDQPNVKMSVAGGVDIVLPDLRAMSVTDDSSFKGALALDGLRAMWRHVREIIALFV